MKVRFTKPFDYTPSLSRRTTIAYPAGWHGTVKRECGELAIAEGKAEPIEEPAADAHEDPAT